MIAESARPFAGELVMERAAIGRPSCPMRTVCLVLPLSLFSLRAAWPICRRSKRLAVFHQVAGQQSTYVRRPYGSVRPNTILSIDISLTEAVRDAADGGRVARLFVKIKYPRAGGIEPRSATVACTVAPDGQVTALKG